MTVKRPLNFKGLRKGPFLQWSGFVCTYIRPYNLTVKDNRILKPDFWVTSPVNRDSRGTRCLSLFLIGLTSERSWIILPRNWDDESVRSLRL